MNQWWMPSNRESWAPRITQMKSRWSVDRFGQKWSDLIWSHNRDLTISLEKRTRTEKAADFLVVACAGFSGKSRPWGPILIKPQGWAGSKNFPDLGVEPGPLYHFWHFSLGVCSRSGCCDPWASAYNSVPIRKVLAEVVGGGRLFLWPILIYHKFKLAKNTVPVAYFDKPRTEFWIYQDLLTIFGILVKGSQLSTNSVSFGRSCRRLALIFVANFDIPQI